MARTKQCARKTVATYAPRRQLNANVALNQKPPMASLTNVFTVKFDDQKQCEEESISDSPIKCVNCNAILHSESKLLSNIEYHDLQKQFSLSDSQNQQFRNINPDENKQVWICEFCENPNILGLDINIPLKANPCYLISKNNEIHEENKQNEGISIIFCLDLSGSMDCEVDYQNINGKLPHYKKNGYLSRIDCVEMAIKNQLQTLQRENSSDYVGFVTFSDEINIIGTEPSKNKKFSGNTLNNYTEILEKSQDYSKELMKNPISKSFDKLCKKLKQFKTGGGTALGPGLLASVGLASKGKPGSKVIICTDGCANEGLGDLNNKNKIEESKKFYEKVGNYAKSKGISISVITIKNDSECDLQNLSKLSMITNGIVNRVDPNKISSDFTYILKDEITGINGSLVMRLNRAFKFLNENKNELKDHDSLLEKDIGNFGPDTELTMEFELKSIEEIKEQNVNNSLTTKNKLPMQMQLTYLNKNKDKYLQIFTDWREINFNNEIIEEKDIDLHVFSKATRNRMANLVQQGKANQALDYSNNVNLFLNTNLNQTKQQSTIDKIKNTHATLNTLIMKKQKAPNLKRKTNIKRKKRNDRSRSRSRSRSIDKSESELSFNDEENQVFLKNIKNRRSLSRSRSRSRSK